MIKDNVCFWQCLQFDPDGSWKLIGNITNTRFEYCEPNKAAMLEIMWHCAPVSLWFLIAPLPTVSHGPWGLYCRWLDWRYGRDLWARHAGGHRQAAQRGGRQMGSMGTWVKYGWNIGEMIDDESWSRFTFTHILPIFPLNPFFNGWNDDQWIHPIWTHLWTRRERNPMQWIQFFADDFPNFNLHA